MANLYDYIKWRGDLTFFEAPLCEVDSLIFSLISYLDFTDILSPEHNSPMVPIRAAANSFFARNPDYRKFTMGVLVPKEIAKLFRALKDSKRFRNVNMQAQVNIIDTEKEVQFSAITFYPGDGTAVVAYRGTDDTIVGWKENFNMCFLPVVPAQQLALEYLQGFSRHFNGNIYLVGHSKGGNLSVYAGVHADKKLQKRILQIWNFDGPGFGKNIMEDPDYIAMRPAIRTLVPQSSVVGMLLEHDEKYSVIKSSQPGLLQHNGLTWEVMGNSFIRVKNVNGDSKYTDQTINQWIKEMTPQQREEFVEAFYRLLSSNNAATLTDLVSIKNKSAAKDKEKLDPEVHKTIQKTLGVLIELSAKQIWKDIFQKK